VHKRTLPCSTTARRGAAPRSVHVHCRRGRERRGAVQRSRRGAQGYHYGGSRHSLPYRRFPARVPDERTNERTLARSFARSPSLCFPRRARTHNTERKRERKRERDRRKKKEKTSTAFPYTCLACVCMSALQWRDERVHTGVDTNAASIESRAYFFLSLFFFLYTSASSLLRS